MTQKTASKKPVKRVNLALQGGGAHGAYTWGVLDRILEEESIEIEGISGTSAGAMNAAVLACGLAEGGRKQAKRKLEHFWNRISDAGRFSPLQQNSIGQFLFGYNLDWSPTYNWFDIISRLYSPYDLNPLNLNPLRYVLDDFIDVKTLREESPVKLFIAATHVESGTARVFQNEEITADVLMASACIPFMFQAVEIDGENYWDGGYMGNPVMWPLIYNTESEDVLLVQINPIHREGLPKRAYQIVNRLNEISFNSSLIAEMRAIEFVKRLLHDGRLEKDHYKDMRVHLIYSADEMHALDASSKMNTGWEFFTYLRDMGYKATDEWLKAHYDALGKEDTLNIHEKFLRNPLRLRAKAQATSKDKPIKKRTPANK